MNDSENSVFSFGNVKQYSPLVISLQSTTHLQAPFGIKKE